MPKNIVAVNGAQWKSVANHTGLYVGIDEDANKRVFKGSDRRNIINIFVFGVAQFQEGGSQRPASVAAIGIRDRWA